MFGCAGVEREKNCSLSTIKLAQGLSSVHSRFFCRNFFFLCKIINTCIAWVFWQIFIFIFFYFLLKRMSELVLSYFSLSKHVKSVPIILLKHFSHKRPNFYSRTECEFF